MVSGADDNSRPRLREEVRDGFDRVVKTEQIFKPKWEIGTGNCVCRCRNSPDQAVIDPTGWTLVRFGLNGSWFDEGK